MTYSLPTSAHRPGRMGRVRLCHTPPCSCSSSAAPRLALMALSCVPSASATACARQLHWDGGADDCPCCNRCEGVKDQAQSLKNDYKSLWDQYKRVTDFLNGLRAKGTAVIDLPFGQGGGAGPAQFRARPQRQAQWDMLKQSTPGWRPPMPGNVWDGTGGPVTDPSERPAAAARQRCGRGVGRQTLCRPRRRGNADGGCDRRVPRLHDRDLHRAALRLQRRAEPRDKGLPASRRPAEG